MATIIAFHDVDDVDHWLRSPKREELFGSIGVTVRLFVDPHGAKRTGLIIEVPDMAAFQAMMRSEAVGEAMQVDGVHPESLVMLREA
jgi:hypothetical protein